MNTALDKLIAAIVALVIDRGGFITKTKLLKLLYLFDVEYYRVYRQLFTGFHWKYYLLGPWTDEYDPLLNKLLERDVLVRTHSRNPDYDTEFYRSAQFVEIKEALPEFKDENLLRVILNTWADKTTGQILDYVYFHTEPMIQGERFKPLNFTLIPEDKPVTYVRSSSGASPKQIRDVRREFEKRKAESIAKQVSISFTPPKYDDEFFEAMEKLEQMNY